MMSLPKHFQAATISHIGGAHTLESRTLSDLAEGEVAIRITATAINPADWKFRETNTFIPEYPAVLGSDAAGEIAAIGPGVLHFNVGDRVFFQGILDLGYQSSTFQQYCKMPASLVARTPKCTSDEEAAGVQLATMAAVTAFYDTTGFGLPAPWDAGGQTIGHGKAVVILGGSSSAGQYAIQLARLSGFERIITNSSATHVQHLKALGAHMVLDRHTQAKPEDFHDALGSYPLLFVFDVIGVEATLVLGVKLLQLANTPNATLIRPCGGLMEDFFNLAAGRATDEPLEVTEQAGKEPKVVIKSVLGIGALPSLRYLSEPLSKHLGGEDGYIAKGLFKPNRPLVVSGGLSAVETALNRNKQGVSGEKVVIRPFE